MKDLIKFRENYISEIKKSLLGPGSEVSIPDEDHELISSRPDVRYSIGILFPQKSKIELDNDELDTENEDEGNIELKSFKGHEDEGASTITKVRISDDNLDEEVSLSTQNLPASMGVSFVVSGNVNTVICSISFATYEKAVTGDCILPNYQDGSITVPEEFRSYIEFNEETNQLKLKKSITKKEIKEITERDVTEDTNFISAIYRMAEMSQLGYIRVPHDAEVILNFKTEEYIDDNRNIDGTNLKATALKREIKPGVFSITIMIVNEEHGKSNGRNCIFQSEIAIHSEKNNFKFIDLDSAKKIEDSYEGNEEELELELLYRSKRTYATGLGNSCDWKIDESGSGVIKTNYLPLMELPPMDFNLNLDESSGANQKFLSMKFLSDLDDTLFQMKIAQLTKLNDSYESWIIEKQQEIDKFSEKDIHLAKVAKKNISKCNMALERMRKGINLLKENIEVRESFELANRAMFMQREQLKIQRELSDIDRYAGDQKVSELILQKDYLTAEDSHFWRPFQLAFILLSIESIINDKSDDRDIVDLIWFPTGGGKTEAYLGLTAFSIFFRRFHHRNVSSGTTVIMRYTLRLLAAQQFTRAATLICACEFIRKDSLVKRSKYKKYNLGKEEITIGLWIGGEHTPNKNDKAKTYINELSKAVYNNLDNNKEEYNKFQVLKCPWCGTKMEKDIKDKKIIGEFGYKMDRNHFFMHCTHSNCDFHIKLPIQIIDEELYNKPPTLLFGTVDKFAMLPWKQEVGNFFGDRKGNRPPELIIQDELHLISGPLGTIVGLYESAIDSICEYRGIKPKIVASTATIRRAKEQCSGLYNREVNQFPPAGINAEDSFFARESIIDHDKGKFGRIYLGMMPSGKTKAMMEIRTISTYLQSVFEAEVNEFIKDKYWTLTLYFNSLKELGKCRTLIEDDVKDAVKRHARRKLSADYTWRRIGSPDELTSRVSTVELNKTLDKLEKLQYSKENIEKHQYASNTLIATNMISVGIDVDRLNAMILVGQPKLTSEYIQASSRVGRKYPGLVTVLYDGSKSRDRSHYEQFIPYHQSYYRYVEPTGVTPFSKPAIERALHSVVVGIMRSISDLDTENSASEFQIETFADEIKYIKDYILSRYKEISRRNNYGTSDESHTVQEKMDDFFRLWEEKSESFGKGNYSYGNKFMRKHPQAEEGRLLKSFNSSRYDLHAIDTLTSMRNVDSTVRGNVLVWEEE